MVTEQEAATNLGMGEEDFRVPEDAAVVQKALAREEWAAKLKEYQVKRELGTVNAELATVKAELAALDPHTSGSEIATGA